MNEGYPSAPEREGRGLPRSPAVVVVGATGLVGEVLLRVLEEREFPLSGLRALASARSSGERVSFRGESIRVEEATNAAFEGADLVFFAATGGLSRTLAPAAVERGAIVIDKSSAWRMDPRVPLVVPEVNPAALARHAGIVACPNCTTIGVVMALAPLRALAGLERIVGTTLQAASGVGRAGLDELLLQERAESDAHATFPAVLARNAIPQCDAFTADGETLEEEKLRLETRKILEEPLEVAMTCVRVPVPVGHGASLWIETERAVATPDVLAALRAFPGLRVVGEGAPPTPRDAAGNDDVWIGRVRVDPERRVIQLWQVADNLRKGAATNSVQIAELLLGRAAAKGRATSSAPSSGR